MKKFFYFAMMAIVTLGMTACGSDDDANGPLVGSQWSYEESYSETEDGVTYESVMTATLKFTNETQGQLVMSGSYTVNGQPMGPSYDETQAFTYVYDGSATEGRGTMTAIDEETGESMNAPFVVNGDQLSMTDIDIETGETMTVVFTRK